MVSTPSFDPNNFTSDDGDEYMASLRSDVAKPFMNKVVEGLYPPGSTFKIVVALAGLESGAITPTEKVFCPGHWDYGDRRYHCWEAKGRSTPYRQVRAKAQDGIKTGVYGKIYGRYFVTRNARCYS